jgi:hypothetical protein
MNKKNIFIIILVICLFLIIYKYKYEKFVSNDENGNGNGNGNGNRDLNLYFVPLKNIFLDDNFYNYNLNRPRNKEQTQSLGEITFNSNLYSKPTTQKIICSSHINRADCWEDNVNNCQWVHKIDGGSYCDVGPNIWP